jgi:hypothetical protein
LPSYPPLNAVVWPELRPSFRNGQFRAFYLLCPDSSLDSGDLLPDRFTFELKKRELGPSGVFCAPDSLRGLTQRMVTFPNPTKR